MTRGSLSAPSTGEGSRNRTYNQRIKSPMLYQLSYAPGDARDLEFSSELGATRTPDLRVRSPALYPTELRALLLGASF